MRKIATAIIAGLAIGVAGTAASAASKNSVTIGGGPYLDVPQISQAMDKNLWKKHGVTAKVVPFRTGRAAFEALIGGQLDFALMAEFPAVIGAMRKLDFGVLAEMSQYTAGRIISSDKIDLKSMTNLAGQKIGTTIGTNVHFMLSDLLKKAGVKAEIINVSPPDIVAALVRGDIDAAAMFPSFYGGAKRSLGSRYRELRISNYRTRFILVGTGEIMKDHPKTVRSVLAALMDGEKLVKSDPVGSQQAVARIVKGKFRMDYIKSSWANYQHRMTLQDDLLDLMVREGKWIAGRGSIKGVKSTRALYRPFFRGEFLKAVAADRVNLR
jgi:NitT/TauT family transport system substrate-binding protein